MIITNTSGHEVEFATIGHIRAKQLTGDRAGSWELEIWPPQYSGAFANRSTMAELEVSREEAERIERVAPHLMLASPTETQRSARKAQGRRNA